MTPRLKLLKLFLPQKEEKILDFVFNSSQPLDLLELDFILEFIEKNRPEKAQEIIVKFLETLTGKELDRVQELAAGYGMIPEVERFIKPLSGLENPELVHMIKIIGMLKLDRHQEELISIYPGADESVKAQIVRALGAFSGNRASHFLHSLVNEKSERILTELLFAYQNFNDFATIIKFCHHANPTMRMIAVGCLGQIKIDLTTEKFNILRIYQQLLADPNDMVRLSCIRNIVIADTKIIKRLFRLLDEMNPFYHRIIITALQKIGTDNPVVAEQIVELVRRYVVSVMLRTLKKLNDNDFILSLQRTIVLKEKREELLRIKDYFIARELGEHGREVKILRLFVNGDFRALKEVFRGEIENISSLADIAEEKEALLLFVPYYIELTGRLKIKELEQDLFLLAHYDDPRLCAQSIVALLDMGAQGINELIRREFPGFDGKTKTEILRKLPRTFFRMIYHEMIEFYQSAIGEQKMLCLEKIAMSMDNRQAQFVAETLEKEQSREAATILIRGLPRLARAEAIDCAEKVLKRTADDAIKLQCLRTLLELGVIDSFAVLREHYQSRPDERGAVIEVMADVYSEVTYSFLIDQMISCEQKQSDRIFSVLSKRKNQMLAEIAYAKYRNLEN
ncbi:MAG: hypothetical protein PHQ23_14765 [Candidatus Wallbacteria bacterium]|nr:hypothetical protein [Candidatus Wallbacteria bacterium]